MTAQNQDKPSGNKRGGKTKSAAPAASLPEAETASQPAASQPAASQPEQAKPNSSKSDTSKSGTQQPAVPSVDKPASAKPATGKPGPRPRNTALLLAGLALLLTVGLAVGGYFIWHEVQRLGAAQQQLLTQVDSRSQGLGQRLDTFKDRLENDLAASERTRREVQDRQRELADAQTGLENALTVLRAQLGRSHDDWTLAEVQYLLQIANQRLQLQRDVLTAKAALQSADQRLQELADPGFNAVRKQIAQELGALKAVAQPDLPGIALTLTQLSEQIPELPLKEGQRQTELSSGEDSQQGLTVSDWKRLPGKVWDALKQLVVVRRKDEPIGPMLAPEQRYFLYQNLQLQLDAARLAALQAAADNYRASLQMANRWLDEYFATDSAPVKAVQEELQRLLKLDVRPALPDISASLRQLKQQLHLSDLAVDAAKQRQRQPSPAGSTDSGERAP